MNKNLRFCFKVDKSVGLSEDEDGNPSDFFICLKSKNVNSYELDKEAFEYIRSSMKIIAANQLNCDPHLVTAITLNEYLDETGYED